MTSWSLRTSSGSLLPGPPGRRGETPQQRSAEPRVWILADGEPKAIPVRTGLGDGRRTAVTDGALEAGDRVITDMATPAP